MNVLYLYFFLSFFFSIYLSLLANSVSMPSVIYFVHNVILLWMNQYSLAKKKHNYFVSSFSQHGGIPPFFLSIMYSSHSIGLIKGNSLDLLEVMSFKMLIRFISCIFTLLASKNAHDVFTSFNLFHNPNLMLFIFSVVKRLKA